MGLKIGIDGAGRVVIPKAIRDRLGLGAGSALLLEDRDDGLVLRPEVAQAEARERSGFLILTTEIEGLPDHRELREERLGRQIGAGKD